MDPTVGFFTVVSALHRLLPPGWTSDELLGIAAAATMAGAVEAGCWLGLSEWRWAAHAAAQAGSLLLYRRALRSVPFSSGERGRVSAADRAVHQPPRFDTPKPHRSWFRDSRGRAVLFRGVNLGGSSKLPASPAAARTSWDEAGLRASTVSFVGRPFPLDEADEHLQRLSVWGLTLLRFIITWEAVEHAGPGQYDQEYIEYLKAVIQKADKYGLFVIIDPHQDVWSRWTGGDGAPRWTLEKVGFDPAALHDSGAAIWQQRFKPGELPKMTWPTGYARVAAATMFTVFYAGDIYAPSLQIDGEPAQHYLQRHFCAAIAHVAGALRHHDNVVGVGTGNEPSKGFIGCADLRKSLFAAPLAWDVSAWDAMRLGAGETLRAPFYSGMFVYDSTRVLNPDGVAAWTDPARDVWLREGVWERGADGRPKLLRPEYFATHPRTREPVDMLADCLAPLYERVAEAVRAVAPELTVFAEPHIDPLNPSHPQAPRVKPGQWAWAPHWYDAIVLMLKRCPKWLAIDEERQGIALGAGAVARTFERNVSHIGRTGTLSEGRVPVIVGESGVAFDLDGGAAYRTGDFSAQVRAMDRTMSAMEAALVGVTIWCYTSDNRNGCGDQWNGEDLSVWCEDQRTGADDISDGGRALPALVRPYPMRTAGDPVALRFDVDTRVMSYTFDDTGGGDGDTPTVFFVPLYQYPRGYHCAVAPTAGRFERRPAEQLLLYYADGGAATRTVLISPANGPPASLSD